VTSNRGPFEEQTYGRYRLLAPIGEGGMAEVFKAKSFGVEGFEKIVVIKRILPKLARNKAFIDMFVHEAKLAVRLSHANIVQVFDLGRVDALPRFGEEPEPPSYFMAMEHVAGLDLATVLERCTQAGLPLPPGLAMYVVAEAAKGLDHAHRRRDDGNQPLGIVHRDVSPQNILISWEGEIKVTDFGIAKARDNLHEATEDSRLRLIKGKYAYMSPEQARAEVVDARSDIFSLGTVLYELLAGSNPFKAPHSLETLRRVREAEYPPIELLRQDISPALAALVHKAMASQPAGRFEDAGRMYEALLTHSYQANARFGASDLAEFLQQMRQARPAATTGTTRVQRTPVEVPVGPPSLALPEAPTGSGSGPVSNPTRAGISLLDATVLCLSAASGRGSRSAEALPREIVERATALFARHGGRRVGEPQDGELLSVFGLGEPDARDTEHAVRCALVVLRSFPELRVRFGVGVHAGRVAVGSDGSLVIDERSGALIERARQLAAEIAPRAGISEDTARRIRGLFALEPRPLGDGLAFLVGEARAPQDVYGKFIGRKEELALIGTLLGSASKRQIQLVTVSGTQGVGKTRLLHEMDRRLRRGDFNVGFHVAPCVPRGRETPLSGITSMLQVLCGVQEGDGPERALSIEPSLRALGLLDEEVEAVLLQLGVPNIQVEGPYALRSAFVKMLMSLAEDRVHVFAWDDAHWLDEATIQLLSAAMRRLAATRTTIILAGRDSFEPPLRGARTPQHIALGELPAPDVLRLIASRLGAHELPPELVAFCQQRAGGHPLYLEELLRDLVDEGAVVVENSHFTRVALDGEMAAPRPLRALLAARVARLPAVEQAALQVAAIQGASFEVEQVVEQLGGGEEARHALTSLESRELVYPSGYAHVFASPLMRDVLLDSLPAEEKTALHARAAAALERALEGAPSSRTDESIERVASHYLEAGDAEHAGLLQVKLAQTQLAASHYDAAGRSALRALSWLDLSRHTPVEIIDTMRLLARAVDRTRVAPEAAEVFARILAHLDAHGTDEERSVARVQAARVLGATSRFEAALSLIEEARAWQGGSSLPRHRLIEAQLHARRGDFNRSLQVLATIDLDAGLEPDVEHRALLLLAQGHGGLGERDTALAYLDRASQSPPEDAAAAAEHEKLRGLIHYFSRGFAESIEANQRAAELARKGGLIHEIAISLHNQADAYIHLGDLPRAYAMLQQSLTACEQCDGERMASENRMYLGYLDAMQDLPGGELQLRSGISHAEEQGYTWDVVNGRYLLGLLLEHVGLAGAAIAEFNACGQIAREVRNHLIASECDRAIERCELLRTPIPPTTSAV
jgi:serine/threonine protein kinase/tetratricopeptide (TPR) repeat protein